ncbi:MAG: zinc ribbon domain-containing protein [Dehalococcoidia bacterium]
MSRGDAPGILKCPKCRQPLPEGARFCLVCGAPVGSPGREAGSESGGDDTQLRTGRSGGASTDKRCNWHLTLVLLGMLIGGVALTANGLVPAIDGGGGDAPGVRPLARDGLAPDTRESLPDPGDATTGTIAPGDETPPKEIGRDGSGGGISPPATGIASPDLALASAFGLASGETVVSCAAAEFGDALCHMSYLTNIEQGRYLYQVGPPFSEPFAWALVEQQGDGTFATIQTAVFDFEGDGTPPFSPGGAMAGVILTRELLDGRPADRLDDGNNALPAGATEVFIYIRYSGLQMSDEATTTLDWDGSSIGEPERIDIDPSGDGWAALRIANADGADLAAGTYTVTVTLNGATIALARLAVLAD